MKKILLTLIIALFACAPLMACTGNTYNSPTLKSPLPWVSAVNFFKSETTVYKVTKYYMNSEEDKIAVTKGNSFLEFVITPLEEGDNMLFELTTNCTIVYSDSEYLTDEFKNKTDSFSSKAVFRQDLLSAVRTEKTVTLQSQPEKSYSFKVDYNSGQASFTSSGETKSMSFDPGIYFDNEYLYYYVRAFQDMGASLNREFRLVNWYECFLNNKFKVTSMTASVYSGMTEGVKVDNANILQNFPDDQKDTTNNQLVCYPLQLILGGTKTGAPLYAYYTVGSYSTKSGSVERKSSSLIAQLVNFEYTTKGKIVYRTEYVINDFIVAYK